MTSLFARNAISNILGQAGLMVLGFVAIRFVFRLMGTDAVGIILFTLTLSTVLTAVLELGICATTVREVSSHINDDAAYVQRLIQTASTFYWVAYVVLAAAVWVAAPRVVAHWIHLEALEPRVAVETIRLLCAGALTAIPRSLYASVLRGMQRMDVSNAIDVGANLVQQAGIIVVLNFGGEIRSVAVWMSLSFVSSVALYAGAVRRWAPRGALRPGVSPDVVRRNRDYSLRMMWISLLSVVQLQADKLVVSKLLPLGSFGVYSFGYTAVSRGGALFSGAIVQAAFPALSERFRRGGSAAVTPEFSNLQDLVLFLGVPIFAAVPFASTPVLSIVFDPAIASLMLAPMTWIAVGFYMNGVMNVPYIFSVASGRPDITARANTVALFVVLPATVALIYAFGLIGAGFSWVVYHIFSYGYTIPRICRECLNLPVSAWYREFAISTGAGIVAYGTAWLGLRQSNATGLGAIVLSYAAGTAAFATISWIVFRGTGRPSVAQALRRGLA